MYLIHFPLKYLLQMLQSIKFLTLYFNISAIMRPKTIAKKKKWLESDMTESTAVGKGGNTISLGGGKKIWDAGEHY